MKGWLILRTSGSHTLALAKSLCDAGHEAWSPARILRRYVRANTPSGKRAIETVIPILPTFVFSRWTSLAALTIAASEEHSPHPSFSIFNVEGYVPEIRDSEIDGLRAEEAEAAAIMAAMHSAETRVEAERIRIAAIKSAASRRRAERELERDRRAALRRSPIAIANGAEVEVVDMPALVGVRGVFERTEGPYAHVRFGTRSWKIEGWRVCAAPTNDNSALRSTAA